MTSSDVTLAPRWRRLLALCYEAFLVFAILLVGGGLFDFLIPKLAGGTIQFLFVVSLLFGYFGFCWRRSGQTLAMKVWRLRLEQVDGSAAGWKSISVRFSLMILAYLPLAPAWVVGKHVSGMKWLLWVAMAWAVLPYVWAWLDANRQFLHDRLAKTRIVLTPIERSSDEP